MPFIRFFLFHFISISAQLPAQRAVLKGSLFLVLVVGVCNYLSCFSFIFLYEIYCLTLFCIFYCFSALTVFFSILKSHGELLKPHWWQDLFQVILRLFDTFKLSEDFQEKFEWLSTTCNHALYAIVDVFTEYFPVLRQVVFSDVLQQLIWCIQQDSDQLARSSVNCFESLVLQNGAAFTQDEWASVCKCVVAMFKATTPEAAMAAMKVDDAMQALSEERKDGNNQRAVITRARRTTSISRVSPEQTISGDLIDPRCWSEQDNRFWPLIVKAVAHLELVKTIESFLIPIDIPKREESDDNPAIEKPLEAEVIYASLGANELFVICDSLMESHECAKRFNRNMELRTELWRLGYGGRQRPALIRQEVDSLYALLRILFFMYTSDCTAKHREELGDRLGNRFSSLAATIFTTYPEIEDDLIRESYCQVVICLFESLKKLPEEKFKIHLRDLYTPAIALLDSKSDLKPEVRKALANLLRQAAIIFNIVSPTLS